MFFLAAKHMLHSDKYALLTTAADCKHALQVGLDGFCTMGLAGHPSLSPVSPKGQYG